MPRVLALVARDHGLAGLKTLLDSEDYTVAAIATHRHLPRSEDPARSERPEFAHYAALAAARAIPLLTVDTKHDQEEFENLCTQINYDVVLSISWRRWIPTELCARAAYGGINLHRGKLPEYAGAEPIKRALEMGDTRIKITAHVLDEEIDAGEVLATVEHPAERGANESVDAAVERLKREITPLFGPLLIETLNKITKTGELTQRS